MPYLLGLDVGTTTITALVVDAASGEIVIRHTVPNDADVTSDRDRCRGRSEWDPRQIAHHATACLRRIADELNPTPGKLIESRAGQSLPRLVGSGNGLRENLVLAKIVADRFGMPLVVPRHREEAAFGAALVAAIGLDVLPDIEAAGKLIRYSSETDDVGSGSANPPG